MLSNTAVERFKNSFNETLWMIASITTQSTSKLFISTSAFNILHKPIKLFGLHFLKSDKTFQNHKHYKILSISFWRNSPEFNILYANAILSIALKAREKKA